MPSAPLTVLLALIPMMGALPALSPDEPEATTQSAPAGEETAPEPKSGDAPQTFGTPRELLDALATRDAEIRTLSGVVRYTIINALENDRQMRIGKLAIKNGDDSGDDNARRYAVHFNTLQIDQRQEEIDEHYIFDGRWFVERLPEEKQFNKRELVPAGETLDPMALMRDAPFWVSLGRDQDRLLASYDAQLLPTTDGLLDNPDFPELRFLAELPHVQDATQLRLTPREGSGHEDDWEWVRIWVNTRTLLPTLYIKLDWTGDLQIVELFGTKVNAEVPDAVFDTTTPDPRSGWRVQINHWRD